MQRILILSLFSLFVLVALIVYRPNLPFVNRSISDAESTTRIEQDPTDKGKSLVGRGGWVSGYFPSWSWQANTSKNKIVSMGCFTHVIFVCGSPSDGNILWNQNAESMLREMVPTMRANGIKSIFQLCCDWSSSVTGTSRGMFILNLLNVLTRFDMDGIDIDWEPIKVPAFWKFAESLRDSMTARWPNDRKLILSYANPGSREAFASPTHEYVDQINIQGYDFVSPSWSVCTGWGNDYHVTWHQGPCYSGGATCPKGQPLLNLNDLAQRFVDLGIPRKKIGISARWNGSVWKGGAGTTTGGVTQPLQSWDEPPVEWNDQPYYGFSQQVGRNVDALPRIHDTSSGATYIGYDGAGSENDFFISYDDSWACSQKVQLVQDSLYGGIYVWTIDGAETVDGHYPQADSLRMVSHRRP